MLGSLALSRYTHDFYLDNVSTGGGVENADHYGARGQLLIPLGSAARSDAARQLRLLK
jgi:hypothetical protein